MKNPDAGFITFRFRHAAAAFVTLVGIALTSCSPPPPLDQRHLPDWCHSLAAPVALPKGGTAYGEVAIKINGETHNGSMDLIIEKTGSIKTDFYGPLGISVASLSADTMHGIISFRDSVFSFGLNQTMDAVPLEWGKNLVFADFLHMILGKIPESATEIPCKNHPDSIGKKRNTIFALWKTDSC